MYENIKILVQFVRFPGDLRKEFKVISERSMFCVYLTKFMQAQ